VTPSPRILAPPALIALACAGLGGLLEHLVPAPIPGLSDSSSRVWLALALLSVSGLLLVGSLLALSARKTTASPYGLPTALVAAGPYRFSRNPLYLSLLLLLPAFGLALDTCWLALAAVPLFALLHFGVVRPEEELLRQRFGQEFTAYCTRVRRWI
jgi:protein-S-isoprenylcysteine O-methyltransferase Ste14